MSKHYDILYIQQYLEGKLDSKDMHQIEHDALSDAMLRDAIDGFHLQNSINQKQLSLLQQRLSNRIESQYEIKNKFYFTGQRLAVASVAGVMLIVSCILFWIMNFQQNDSQTQQTEVTVQLQNKAQALLVKGSLSPKGGWDNYQDYLTINATGIAEGESVHLSFEVREGQPENIMVLSKNSNLVSQEVIRLIKDGPSWNGASGEISIEF